MSTPYEETGRTSQKKRTRDLLISVARHLVQQGVASPTVEEVAVAAGVSRTTAYRYFADQRALLVAAHPEINRTSLLEAEPPTDPEARFLAVVDAFTTLVVETELQLRTMLRLSLAEPATTNLPLRQGRAIGWFEEALEGVQPALPDNQLRRFVQAVRSATGIEALVWLTDVAGLSRAEAMEVMRWSARALLKAALTDGPPPA